MPLNVLMTDFCLSEAMSFCLFKRNVSVSVPPVYTDAYMRWTIPEAMNVNK